MRVRTVSIAAAIAVSAVATTVVATPSGPTTIERAAVVAPSSAGDLAQARRISESGSDPVDDSGGDGVGRGVDGPLPIAGIGEAAATLLPDFLRPTGVEDPLVRGSVVISEVMFDPSVVYDSRGEWFEVVNTTGGTIDLGGWTFGDEVYDIHTISDLSIAPGDRVVLGRVADPARNGGVVVDHEFGDAVLLFNGGDRIVLRNASGSIVDVVDYGLPGFTRPEGRSISYGPVIAAAAEVANDSGATWCRSTTTLPAGDFGSPGAPNQCARSTAALVITEVMNNPSATADSVGEWFELRNTGAAIDLAGFSVQDDDGEKFTIDSPLPVPAGANVVFARNGDPSVNGGVTADWVYGSQMNLHNTFDELVVTDERGIQVDAVRWDDGRTFPDPNGQSMQLAAVVADNADGVNWCLSTRRWSVGDTGSPGTDGSCDVTEVPLVVITEVMADPELTPSERDGEWFEVANLGSEPAVLDGYSLRTRSEEHVVSSLTIPSGERAVLAVLADRTANGDVPVDYAYGTDLSLFNAAGLLEIVTADGVTVDRVDYSLTRGFPLEKARSMELGSTTADNALGANWCATIDRYNDEDFGTPGIAGNCDEPDPAQPLMISEVMRDPAAVSDTSGEWFEVHNPTSDPVDLRNWSISDDGSERYVIRRSVVVPPLGFAVIGRSGDTGVNGGVAVDLVVGSGMVLYNGQDAIRLHDQHGRSIDEVRWMPSDPMPRPNGGSMSRSEASLASFGPTDDASAWCTTSDQFGLGDTGTPGAANTCTPTPSHAIVINEIHRDPLALPDAQAEWIELHNTGAVPIDIGGWTLRDDDVDSFVFPAGSVIGADGYVTAGRNDASLNGGIDMDVLYGIEIVNFNTTDELMLFDADLAIVDRVAWTAENGFPKVAGATMSLRNPALDNAAGVNWCAAVTDQ
ncbi:MAG: lamin tail domain-containing protein, partial [Ilumatobacter sp.]